MSDLFDARAVPLHVQITAAEREVRYRERVYPRWIEAGLLRRAKADREMAAMKAIVVSLQGLADGEGK